MKHSSFGTLLLYPVLFFNLTRICTSLDTIISPSHSLRDGETLVSSGQIFELGFFSLSDPIFRYLGIWYKISPTTIVWVANRETPLPNVLGALNITSQGKLVLFNVTKHVFWSSSTPRTAVKDPVAQLLDSGNFVVREADNHSSNQEKFLWQSFDFPCDTLLPGLKLGTNLESGLESFISSWKSMNDPSTGHFSVHIDLHGYPQILIKKDNRTLFRGGSWNGLHFSGTPILKPDHIFTIEFEMNDCEVYYKYEVINSTLLLRSRLDPSGLFQRFSWNDQVKDWRYVAIAQTDQCENYDLCGENASCEINDFSICVCLDGFTPKNPNDWNKQIWSGGCVPRTPIDCNGEVGFLKVTGRKLPDTSSSWYNKSIDLKKCESLCWRNCSCTAYASLDIRNGGSGCLLWFTGLIDIRGLDGGGQDLFVKMDASELAKIQKKKSSNKKKAGVISGLVAFVITLLTVFCILRRRYRKQGMRRERFKKNDEDKETELPMFDLATIADATDNFSSKNKLGEGGFGPVYKGTMRDGQEIAVKRLSKGSGQGSSEFKNEVILIAKLQHRNLVKLLGCCIQEDEKMLVYEYMPNKSLDSFIFDQTKSRFIDWHKRINIVAGIARGLLYLHQDSRLRIIHRDLKISNILLDSNMNPKISDFGLARTFGGDQTEDNTKRVVGTYGYMSPEYAVDGLFSVKSDVFSYGVMVLEIISGKKNRGFSHPEHGLNLLGHAWMLWNKGTALELIDECLTDSFAASEVIRCINVALLCVQQRPEDRPNMSSVVVMLSSEISLPEPKEPGFFLQRTQPEADTSSNQCSVNDVTFSVLEAR